MGSNICKNDVDRIFSSIFKKYSFTSHWEISIPILDVFEYINATTGLSISYDNREGLAQVGFCRLQNGAMPSGLAFDPPNGYLVDNLLGVVNNQLYTSIIMSGAIVNYSIEEKLEFYASSLERFGSNILMGDFSIYPELAHYIQHRLRENEA